MTEMDPTLLATPYHQWIHIHKLYMVVSEMDEDISEIKKSYHTSQAMALPNVILIPCYTTEWLKGLARHDTQWKHLHPAENNKINIITHRYNMMMMNTVQPINCSI